MAPKPAIASKLQVDMASLRESLGFVTMIATLTRVASSATVSMKTAKKISLKWAASGAAALGDTDTLQRGLPVPSLTGLSLDVRGRVGIASRRKSLGDQDVDALSS